MKHSLLCVAENLGLWQKLWCTFFCFEPNHLGDLSRILWTCVCVCGRWHSGHVSGSWPVDDFAYYRLCKGWNTRKRPLLRAKRECAFPERSCCAHRRTEPLCGQKNNTDPFALLSYRDTASNKEATSVDCASIHTRHIIEMTVRKELCDREQGCQEAFISVSDEKSHESGLS